MFIPLHSSSFAGLATSSFVGQPIGLLLALTFTQSDGGTPLGLLFALTKAY